MGKLADFVVLPDNPLGVAVNDIPRIQVRATVIGGAGVFCAPSFEHFCESAPAVDPSPTKPVAAPTVDVAVSGPASGAHAELGPALRNAAEMAFQDVGAGQNISMQARFVDDRCDEAGGKDAATAISANPDVVAMLGPACSASARGALPLLEAAGIPAISSAATQPQLGAFGPAVFNRTIPYDGQPGAKVDSVSGIGAVQDFYARYEQQFGSLPAEMYRPYLAYTYDAATILARALQTTASVAADGKVSVDRVALAKAIRARAATKGSPARSHSTRTATECRSLPKPVWCTSSTPGISAVPRDNRLRLKRLMAGGGFRELRPAVVALQPRQPAVLRAILRLPGRTRRSELSQPAMGRTCHTALMDAANDFCGSLGMTLPVVQAPIGSASTPELAAAVSEAGGLGMLALTWTSIDGTRRRIRATQQLTSRRFGVNVAVHGPQVDRVTACLEEGVDIVSTFWGDPGPYSELIHQGGALHIHTVGSADEARRAVDRGVDVVVAQGWEAGGHVWGEVATLPLVPAVVDAVHPVPVLAAGGIADGRGLAAVLALGAAAAWVGTRFLLAAESNVHREYQAAIAGAAETGTVYGIVFDRGWPDAPHRALRNSTIRAWEAAGRPPAGQRPGENDIVATYRSHPLYRYGDDLPLSDTAGDVEPMAMYAGQSSALVRSVQPAGDIVRAIADEARSLLARLGNLHNSGGAAA